jgi:hypothetical protein
MTGPFPVVPGTSVRRSESPDAGSASRAVTFTTLGASSHDGGWFRVRSIPASPWSCPGQQSENDKASPHGEQRAALLERVVDRCSAGSHLRIVAHEELVRACRDRAIAIGPSPAERRGRLRDDPWNCGSRDRDADRDENGGEASTPVATDRNDRHRDHDAACDQGNAEELFTESPGRSAAAEVVAVVARKDRRPFDQHLTILAVGLDAESSPRRRRRSIWRCDERPPAPEQRSRPAGGGGATEDSFRATPQLRQLREMSATWCGAVMTWASGRPCHTPWA